MIASKQIKRISAVAALAALAALGGWLHWSAPAARRADGNRLVMTVPAGTDTDRIYRTAIAEFERENPGVSVTLIPVAGDYYQKVMVMIAGNVAPDLAWMGRSFTEFADRDVFWDVTGFVERDRIDLSEYQTESLAGVSRNGRLYALPFGMDFTFLVYNRKMFREAGIPEPDNDWTYPEFLDAARKLVVRDESGRIIRYACKGGLDYGVFGASVFDPETGRVRCNDPEMLNYFRTNLDLAHHERVTDRPEDAQMQGLDPLGYFTQERIAMMTLHTWDLPQIRERFQAMDWGMVRHPAVKVHSQWGSNHAICIVKTTRSPEMAWKLVKKFQEHDFQFAMADRMVPARKSFADEFARLHAGDAPYYRALLACRDVFRPSARIPHLQELDAIYVRFSDRVWARQATPEAAMKECELELERRIAAFKSAAERRKQP